MSLIGTQTNNGATILDAKLAGPDGTTYVVLCLWGSEFVVWRMDEGRNCFWGRYHKTLRSAMASVNSTGFPC